MKQARQGRGHGQGMLGENSIVNAITFVLLVLFFCSLLGASFIYRKKHHKMTVTVK